MTLGQQIRQARENKNLSQEELASKMGVSRHEPVIIRLSQEKSMNQGFALI